MTQGWNSVTSADEWTPDAAEAVAASEDLTLTDAHWRVISCWRERSAAKGRAPTPDDLRVCCDISASELERLFPGDAIALLARIGGLPE